MVPDLLRPALELAMAVARRGEAAVPPERAPKALRPYLGFTRSTSPMYAAVRAAVEGDPEFRARVAEEADEDLVGRAGVLWLERPEGWEEELDSEGGPVGAGPAPRRASSREERRSERERVALRRAQQEAASARREATAAEEALTAERLRAAELQSRVEELLGRLEEQQGQRAEAVRTLKEAEGRAVAAATERNELRRRLREQEQQLVTAREELAQRPSLPAGPGRPAPVPDDRHDRSLPDPSGSEVPGVDLDALSGRIGTAAEAIGTAAEASGAAAEATGRAAEALAEVARLLHRRPAGAPPSPGSAPSPPDVPAVRPERRRQSELPGGMLDDSVEAAEHLLRQRRVVVVVDGYNVAKRAWGDLTPSVQRERLVDRLAELSARTGAEVDVVFDGAEQPEPVVGQRWPRGVRVRFSPPDVEADDVVLELIGTYPVDRPVVVVSSDGRVRAGARARGANVIHAADLLAVRR